LFVSVLPTLLLKEGADSIVSDAEEKQPGFVESMKVQIIAKKRILKLIVIHQLMLQSLLRMDRSLWTLMLLYFVSNLVAYPRSIYFTDYMGIDVYGGNATAPVVCK